MGAGGGALGRHQRCRGLIETNRRCGFGARVGTVFLLWFSRVNYILRRVRGGEGGRRRGALQESTARLINAVLYHFLK